MNFTTKIKIISGHVGLNCWQSPPEIAEQLNGLRDALLGIPRLVFGNVMDEHDWLVRRKCKSVLPVSRVVNGTLARILTDLDIEHVREWAYFPAVKLVEEALIRQRAVFCKC